MVDRVRAEQLAVVLDAHLASGDPYLDLLAAELLRGAPGEADRALGVDGAKHEAPRQQPRLAWRTLRRSADAAGRRRVWQETVDILTRANVLVLPSRVQKTSPRA